GNANDTTSSNHGSLVNGTTFEEGLVGQAFHFDAGLHQGVNVGNVDPGDAFTLEAWVQPSSFPNAFPSVLRKDFGTTGGNRYTLAVVAGGGGRGSAHCD